MVPGLLLRGLSSSASWRMQLGKHDPYHFAQATIF
jgi:hypothetical protein